MKSLLLLCFILLTGCQPASVTNFRVVALPENGVDAVVARKIVLTVALDSRHQQGSVVREVFPISKEERDQCLKNEHMHKALGEFCGAQYFVNTKYKSGIGYSSYRVLEHCKKGSCTYRISTEFEGLEE